jgi:two-component system, LytTR family, response regulator LytT
MKVLIIEDEAPAQRRMQKLINECDSSAVIVGIVASVTEGLEWFKNNPLPELIFSDIQLADDLSFKLFKALNITIPIIFTTAYDEYAINAFKFYSIDYLLKPINADELKQSIEKYKNIHQQAKPTNFEEILKSLVEKKFRERFLVYSGDSLLPITTSEIAYFESENGETMLISKSNKRFFIAESLDLLENELDPDAFYRVNRQYIISIGSIDKIFNFGQQKLKITIKPAVEKDIFVSKLKATSFKNWLNR